MAVPFSRSSRTLTADSFRYTLVALLVAAVLLTGWCVWFFGTTIKFTESSEDLRQGEGGTLIVWFPKDKLSRIHPGQQARFFPTITTAKQTGGIAAVVAEVDHLATQDKGQVVLVIKADRQSAASLTDEWSGRVEVEVESASPASLVMRSSGLASGSAETISGSQ